MTIPIATGGERYVIDPWDIDKTDLQALAYSYRVPKRD